MTNDLYTTLLTTLVAKGCVYVDDPTIPEGMAGLCIPLEAFSWPTLKSFLLEQGVAEHEIQKPLRQNRPLNAPLVGWIVFISLPNP